MKLPTTVLAALVALERLAHHAATSTAPMPASAIARQSRLTHHLVRQLLWRVGKRGLQRTATGTAGGFFFAHPLDRITLLDVIEAVDAPVESYVPLRGEKPDFCDEQLIEACDLATKATREILAGVTLADLFEMEEPGPEKKPARKSKDG